MIAVRKFSVSLLNLKIQNYAVEMSSLVWHLSVT